MSVHRYPRASLVADYLRGGLGLAVTALPLLVLSPHWAVALGLGAAAALFAAFFARTVQRQLSVIELSERGIAARGPLGAAIAWPELSALRLTYFSTRRDREGGWMNLTLKGSGRPLKIESTITGFDAIAGRAAAAARANGLRLGEPTMDNLVALGATDRPSDGGDDS